MKYKTECNSGILIWGGLSILWLSSGLKPPTPYHTICHMQFIIRFLMLVILVLSPQPVSCVRQYPPIIWIGPLLHNLCVHPCTCKIHNIYNFKTDVLFVCYGISWSNMQILLHSVHFMEQHVSIVWWVVWSGETTIYVPVKGLTKTLKYKRKTCSHITKLLLKAEIKNFNLQFIDMYLFLGPHI